MSSPQPRGPCPEVGTLATQVLGGVVLLCVAANAIALLCLRPPHRLRLSSVSPEEAHKGAGHSRRGRTNSTCRCSSVPWGLSWRREHKATQTGGGSGSGTSLSLRHLRLAAQASAKASEHSSSWLGAATVLEQRGTRPAGGLSRSRSVSPRGRPLPARPARILLCSLRPSREGELLAPAKAGSDATLGQVVYDARWLRCMMGKARGRPTMAGQREGQRLASYRGTLGPLKAAGCRRWLGLQQ